MLGLLVRQLLGLLCLVLALWSSFGLIGLAIEAVRTGLPGMRIFIWFVFGLAYLTIALLSWAAAVLLLRSPAERKDGGSWEPAARALHFGG